MRALQSRVGEKGVSVIRPDLHAVKQALLDAGLEIYRAKEHEIQVAERVRLHIMDSGVRVVTGSGTEVQFTARSQRSDFPSVAPNELFQKVRGAIGSAAGARGYREASATTVEVKDPVDPDKILDVWHEITYAKATESLEQLVSEVRWALELDKYVSS